MTRPGSQRIGPAHSVPKSRLRTPGAQPLPPWPRPCAPSFHLHPPRVRTAPARQGPASHQPRLRAPPPRVLAPPPRSVAPPPALQGPAPALSGSALPGSGLALRPRPHVPSGVPGGVAARGEAWPWCRRRRGRRGQDFGFDTHGELELWLWCWAPTRSWRIPRPSRAQDFSLRSTQLRRGRKSWCSLKTWCSQGGRISPPLPPPRSPAALAGSGRATLRVPPAERAGTRGPRRPND